MTFQPDDLARPASLTLWSSEPDAPKAVVPRDYPTLREALREAGIAMSADSASPWIITDSGLILSPAWLRGHLGGENASTSLAAGAGPERCGPDTRLLSALPTLPDRKREGERRVRLPPMVVRGRDREPGSAARP